MAIKCPKCGAKLGTLLLRGRASYDIEYEFDGNAYEELGMVNEKEDVTLDSYNCCKCKVRLANNEAQAKAIIAGEIDSELADRFARIAFEEANKQ